MKKSICIETIFTEVPFEERFQLVKKAGFEYVEFWSWEDKNIDRIKELCVKHGLKVASFSGDKDFSMVDRKETGQYIAFAEKSIKVAKQLDCEHLVIHSNALGEGGVVVNDYWEISDFDKITTMFDILKTLAPIAEKAQVMLVLEALNTVVDHAGNYLAYTADSAKLIKMVGSPYIRALYDVYHMQIMEGNIIENINKYIDYIGYIHIADVPGRHEPGTGEINYSNVMRTLQSLHYSGIVGFELFPSQNSVAIADQLINL
jgi:hydroxypyruvate isomerase